MKILKSLKYIILTYRLFLTINYQQSLLDDTLLAIRIHDFFWITTWNEQTYSEQKDITKKYLKLFKEKIYVQIVIIWS